MMMRSLKLTRGLTLVELMVALALGSFLLLGVVNVFVSSRGSAQVETALARVQENGRIALDLLSDDFRNAQYTGCNSVGGSLTVMAKNEVFEGIRAYERRDTGGTPSWSPTLPTGSTSNYTTAAGFPASGANGYPREGSDMINLHMAVSLPTELSSNLTPASTAAAITDNPGCDLEQGDLVVLSSCVTAHMFRVTNAQTCSIASAPNATTLEFAGSGNDITSIVPGYNTESELMQFEDVSWYVADTGRDRNGFDVYALYRLANGTAEEMVEGVEHMQLLFGQRVTGNNMRYVPARDSGLDFDEVIAVRIALLVQSFEPVRDADDTSNYRLLDEVMNNSSTTYKHQGGRAMRQVFQTTAILRNTAFDS